MFLFLSAKIYLFYILFYTSVYSQQMVLYFLVCLACSSLITFLMTFSWSSFIFCSSLLFLTAVSNSFLQESWLPHVQTNHTLHLHRGSFTFTATFLSIGSLWGLS